MSQAASIGGRRFRHLGLRETDSRRQVAEIVKRFDLARLLRPFTRCMVCNQDLRPVSKSEVQDRVPARIWESCEDFRQCAGCRRVYWYGSHTRRMSECACEKASSRLIHPRSRSDRRPHGSRSLVSREGGKVRRWVRCDCTACSLAYWMADCHKLSDRSSLHFPPHILWLFVIPQRHKPAMPQVAVLSPFDKFKLRH
jgi:hypothetical protein